MSSPSLMIGHFVNFQGFANSFGVLLNFYQHDPRSPINPTPNSKLILTLVGTINTGTIGGAGELKLALVRESKNLD